MRTGSAAFEGVAATYGAGYGWGAELVRLPQTNPGIDWAFGSTVLGILRDAPPSDSDDGREPLVVAIQGPEGARPVPARAVLVATGAYDLPVAIPGGTLPGVMMAGAVQSLLKAQKVLTAGPFVLAGGHPLLLVVADQLVKAGAEVSELALNRRLPGPRELLGAAAALPGHAAMLVEMAGSVRRLLAAGVKVRTNVVVTAATGGERVEHVELARRDANGMPSGPRRVLPVGTLVLGYGFLPSTELARQARCELRWDSPLGGWVVVHDGSQRTTVPGIYVAGEPTGVAGADQSRAEGTLAGLGIVADLRGAGAVGADEHDAALTAVAQAARFSRVVQAMFEPDRAGLAALATPETIVCRCELVRRGDLDATLAANPEMFTVNAVKLETRCGMGPCQGRYCESTLATVVAETRGQPREVGGLFSAHFPVKPAPLESLVAMDALVVVDGVGEA